MDYSQVLERAMRMAEQESYSPLDMTYEEILTRIQTISTTLKRVMPHSERILLSAERHGLRLRLQRAEQVAQRLLGGTTLDFDCPKCGRLTTFQKGTPAGSINCPVCQ